MGDMEQLPEEYWQYRLTPDQYRVARQRATEPPFSGVYLDNKAKGLYRCVACKQELFSSTAKYDSGSGWPSFWDTLDKSRLELTEDDSLGMRRIEVSCRRCGAHLGHVFDDGPRPTGKRYCLNSLALDFTPEKTDP